MKKPKDKGPLCHVLYLAQKCFTHQKFYFAKKNCDFFILLDCEIRRILR